MKKKVLILGASNAQIDAIEYCKSHGFEVCGCSYTTADNGIPLLDHFGQVDIKDVDGVVALAKKFGVDAIYSVGSDIAIPTVMEASEILGLPHFISSETAKICHSKHLMRSALGQDFVGNAAFVVCGTLEEALTFEDFPAMMKPVDSQGQRGCFRVDSKEDIEKNFATSLGYSVEGKVIIETFVDGPEISVNAYMQDGELRFAVVSDRIVFDEYPGGIIKEHLIPSTFADEKAKEEAIDLVKRMAEKLHIDNGPCYYQIKLDPENHPIILEVTPRLDGCHMWNLIKHYCGADLLDACFVHLLDNKPVLTQPAVFPKTEYKLAFTCKETGASFDRSEYDCTGAEYIFWYYQTGDRVRKVNGFMEKGGYLIRKTGRIIE
ncbi:MAG: ATP-grasp domain-containing protein [Eubacteriales bacterium]|nr:ATP-grasp domain-containing protein [Eubacteriales bacterium]